MNLTNEKLKLFEARVSSAAYVCADGIHIGINIPNKEIIHIIKTVCVAARNITEAAQYLRSQGISIVKIKQHDNILISVPEGGR
jgi:hypothetical protein